MIEDSDCKRGAARIVGRDEELAAVAATTSGPGATRALFITGGVGIGRSALLDASIAMIDGPVLLARPGAAERSMRFAAIADLLADLGDDVLDTLPPPQRHALEVALVRVPPAGDPPEPLAVAIGLLGVLRTLSEHERVVIAIDDAHWLDDASAAVIAFAARRLDPARLRLLLTVPAGAETAIEAALPRTHVAHQPLGALSIGAVRCMLADRIGLSVSRRELREVHRASQGVPLIALEVGRALRHGGGADLAVHSPAADLLAERVDRLAPAAAKLLAAATLSPGTRAAELERVAGPDAIEQAVAANAVMVDDGQVQPAHPLLGVAVLRRLTPARRRTLHAELAAALPGHERARHLALATEAPDERIATELLDAAATAAVRGAPLDAAELAEHALRLTPEDAPERPARLLALATHLNVAGEADRVAALLAPALETLPAGAPRVQALLLLADDPAPPAVAERHLASALAAAGDDERLRAPVLARLAERSALTSLARIDECAAKAAQALAAADGAGERPALSAVTWTRILRGEPLVDLPARFAAASGGPPQLYRSIERLRGIALAFRGELAPARVTLSAALATADARGEAWSQTVLLLDRCELELRAGAWPAAAELLAELERWPEGARLADSAGRRLAALLAAGRGDAAAATKHAEAALAGAAAGGNQWDRFEALRARGVTALLNREPARAATDLSEVWEHMQREGIDELGAFPVAGDLVECLIATGDLPRARAVVRRLATLAGAQLHPWALATSRRARALLSLAAGGDHEAAAAELRGAAADYQRLGLGFDHARTLLSLGLTARRRRKWAIARDALEAAASAFDALGSPGWAARVRDDLSRIGGRRPCEPGALTASERRVVELASAGLANKEIAQTLFVTVSTVENHLSKTYAKLGVRSRAQLASRLAAGVGAGAAVQLAA